MQFHAEISNTSVSIDWMMNFIGLIFFLKKNCSKHGNGFHIEIKFS